VGWSSQSSGFYGLGQLSLFESDARDFFGALQLGLFRSRAGRFFGALQLAPLTRAEEIVVLAQVGAYNESVFFTGAVQLGLVNMNKRQFVGLLQLALANVHLEPTHTYFAGIFQVGVLNLHQGELFGGAQIGVINLNYRRSEAILALGQLGVANYSTELIAPLQLALLGNVAGRLTGAQVAPLGINWSGEVLGLQLGAFNRAAAIHGAQLALLANVAHVVNGVQLGLFNSATSLRGVQIGLVNWSEDGGLPFSVLLNVGW
jgi:hypothetical protein